MEILGSNDQSELNLDSNIENETQNNKAEIYLLNQSSVYRGYGYGSLLLKS